jgi:hypothetical protein
MLCVASEPIPNLMVLYVGKSLAVMDLLRY